MNKSFHILIACLIAAFSITVMAQQVLPKVDPPTNGQAPYRYIAPIVNYNDDVLNVYPQNVAYWTGTCNSSTKTDNSEVRGVDLEDGWFVFDVSGLPVGATINSITFYGYVNSTSWPYWSLTPMGTINPITDPASTIFSWIASHSAQGTAYVYSNETSTFTTGWHNWALEPQAYADLSAAIAQGWFACGMDSRDNSASYWINFDGWNQANDPYLVIDYLVPTPHDVGTASVDVPALLGVGNVVPKATVFSQSTTPETFNVTMTITPGGYTSTKTVTNLPPAGTMQVTFDNWNATLGSYTIQVCTQLGTDPNAANNCLSKAVNVVNATPGFGYNAYDQTLTYPLGTVSFLCQTPGTLFPTGGVVTDFICAGTFDTWTQTWYGYQYPGTNFYTIDPVGGGLVLLGSGGNGAVRGLAWDPTTNPNNGQLFAVDGTSLYTVNNTNGAMTLVGSSGAYDFIALACSPAGQLYAFDMSANALISINKTTGVGTLVGAFPFDVTYAQGADYDQANNVLYWGAWDSGVSEGRFYIVDPTNATLTPLGYIGTGPGVELDGMGVLAPAIPVELVSFNADVNETSVTLNWTTSTEKNNYGFEVQRTKSEGEYETIGIVEGNGTSTEMHYYSYSDVGLSEGIYNYRLKQVDLDGSFEYSNAILVEVVIPDVYSLDQNFPNPFNPSTKIFFSLAVDSKVTLKVFDLLGQEVATIYNNDLSAGSHNVTFNAFNLNSGVYFYRIEANGINGANFTDVKKMILTK